MNQVHSVEISATATTTVMRETTLGPIVDLPIPRTRHGHQTQGFERYHRRRDELDGAIEEMFVRGVSTTKVGEVLETLTGSHRSRLNGFAGLSQLRAYPKT